MKARVPPQFNRYHRQRGMSLVESVVGLLVLTIVLLACAQLLRVHVQHLALSERGRIADTQANEAMTAFAGYNQSSLPDGNPFQGKGPTDSISDGEQVSLSTSVCQTSFNCDQIIRLSQSSGTGNNYGWIGWNQSVPTGATLLYYRAWRVTTLDSVRHLRRITVAVIPADLGNSPGDFTTPLALRSSDVVQRQ